MKKLFAAHSANTGVFMKNLPLKKTLISIVIIILAGWNAHAKEDTDSRKMAVGIGPEWNMNSRNDFAGGIVLGFDYNLPSVPLALGVNVSGSYNFSQTVVLEAAPFLRWYFPGSRHTGLFVQADAGFYYIMEDLNKDDMERFPMFLGGLRAGYRLPLGSSFYIEPFARGGYPFAFGVGFITGTRF